MENIFGGIKFPLCVRIKSTQGYFLNGKKLYGWEFVTPILEPSGLIIPTKSKKQAARQAYNWLSERGHIESLDNWIYPAEYRLIGFIYSESFFKSMSEDWTLRVASQAETESPFLRFVIYKVGPEGKQPNTRMIYTDGEPYHEIGTLQQWQEYQQLLADCLKKKPLFREDFTFLGRFEEHEDDD